ncbi:PAS domain-containing protein [Halobacillus kuroshimensis]|uniref:PAS domain-containing protein n=1 Tax=Halobacillus kuroshimensis TaxID=302481 RepID=A0ABS3DXC3_9BACI|nr:MULTISPECIES: PAS domain-containing protein [Halobacillus]MBN8236017.1 PAS domain-containing protein [Halobacillus kuroshimensis]
MILQAAMDLLDEGVLISDDQYIITYVNPAFIELFGLQGNQVTGESLHTLFPDIDPERRVVTNSTKEQRPLIIDDYPMQWQGEEYVFKVHTRPFTYEGKGYNLTRIFDRTQSYYREKQLIHIIEEMTANVVKVADGFALLPLQPILREEQKEVLLTRVPELCQNQRIDRLAVQFSGIVSVEDEWVHLLRDLIVSLQLLGIEVVLAGMRPQVVMQFTQNRISLSGVRTFKNLPQAADYFLNKRK